MIWFTSDQHYGHANIISLSCRPFDDVYHMNAELIRRHNAVVGPRDAVYHLGDFAWTLKDLFDVLPRLNGQHYLVPGNHDTCHSCHSKFRREILRYHNAGFSVLPEQYIEELPELGVTVMMCHMPLKTTVDEHDQRYIQWRPDDNDERFQWLLHGHVHEKWKRRGKMINVGVDVWNYAPVSIETISELTRETT